MTPPPRYQLPNPNSNPGLDLLRYRGTVQDMRRAVDAQFTGTASGPRLSWPCVEADDSGDATTPLS